MGTLVTTLILLAALALCVWLGGKLAQIIQRWIMKGQR